LMVTTKAKLLWLLLSLETVNKAKTKQSNYRDIMKLVGAFVET